MNDLFSILCAIAFLWKENITNVKIQKFLKCLAVLLQTFPEWLIWDHSAKSTYRTETCYLVTCCPPPHSLHCGWVSVCRFLGNIYVSVWLYSMWLYSVCASWQYSPLFSGWLADRGPGTTLTISSWSPHPSRTSLEQSTRLLPSVSALKDQTVALWVRPWHWYSFIDMHQE